MFNRRFEIGWFFILFNLFAGDSKRESFFSLTKCKPFVNLETLPRCRLQNSFGRIKSSEEIKDLEKIELSLLPMMMKGSAAQLKLLQTDSS